MGLVVKAAMAASVLSASFLRDDRLVSLAPSVLHTFHLLKSFRLAGRQNSVDLADEIGDLFRGQEARNMNEVFGTL